MGPVIDLERRKLITSLPKPVPHPGMLKQANEGVSPRKPDNVRDRFRAALRQRNALASIERDAPGAAIEHNQLLTRYPLGGDSVLLDCRANR